MQQCGPVILVSWGGEEAPLILESVSVMRSYGVLGCFQCEVVGWCHGVCPCCNTPCYENPKLFLNLQISHNARTTHVIEV
jgi:heterodisulfide reductase subunit C